LAVIELVDRNIEAKKVDIKKKIEEKPKSEPEKKPKDSGIKTKAKK